MLPTVYSSPAWVATKTNYPPPESRMGDFQAFVRAAAERYGANGTFWSSHPSIPKLPVTDWQLWNEVNSPSFWYSKPSPKQYVGLLRVFHAGIKAGDSSARIVLAGLFRTPQVKHGIPLDRFLPAIYKRKGSKSLFDAVAVHPYSTTPRDALTAVKDTRKIMARYKDKRAGLWITEIGWATGGNPTPLTVSPQRQASYLTKTYNEMAANRGRFKIAGVVWYSWRDVPGGIWFDHTGLFSSTLDPKPSWNAFVGLTGGSPARLAARHSRQDHHGVRLAGGCVQAVEHAHVLVVEVDVDVPVEVALRREELVLGRRIALGEDVAAPRRPWLHRR